MTQLSVDSLARPFFSGIRLFNALVKGQLIPNAFWHSKHFRIKYTLRSLLSPITTLKLLNFIAEHELCQYILQAQPDLPCKIQRPYLSTYFSRNEILNALCYHYHCLTKYFTLNMAIKILEQTPYTLATLQGKTGHRFYISLLPINSLSKEGELSVAIYNDEQKILAKATFTLLFIAGKKTLFIGNLQGADNTPHEMTKIAARDCYGLLPKRLVLETLATFATQMDCAQILAVSHNTHVYNDWRYKNILSKNYDSFWRTVGGEPTASGYFRLPLTITRKSFEQIPSKKRAEYRRRYQLLDTLEKDMQQTLFPN